MPDRDPEARPRIALIGYGAIAAMHVEALAELGITPAVVAGPKPAEAEAFAARHGITRASDDVPGIISHPAHDAVILASPSGVHADQARLALVAGHHVLVEIPLALSLAEGEALVALAAERGRILMACHTLRYWAPHAAVQRWLHEGGHEVRHVVARSLSLRLEDVGWTGRRRSWTDDLLWHQGGHVIDATLRLLGEPVVAVTAASGPVWPVSRRAMDHGITLRTAGGAIATIALSYNARIAASDYAVITDRDSLTISGADVRTSGGPLVRGTDAASAQVAAVLAQDRDFVSAISGGPPPLAAAASIMPVLGIQQRIADGIA